MIQAPSAEWSCWCARCQSRGVFAKVKNAVFTTPCFAAMKCADPVRQRSPIEGAEPASTVSRDPLMADDDKFAAEDYRRQKQAVLAEKIGIGPKTRDEQLQWMEDNKEQVVAIVRAMAGPIGDEAAILEEYKRALITTSRGSAFDDINARQILSELSAK